MKNLELTQIIDITFCGIDWFTDCDIDLETQYKRGSIETVAHILACMIAQKYNIGVPTCDMVHIIEAVSNKEDLETELVEYLEGGYHCILSNDGQIVGVVKPVNL